METDLSDTYDLASGRLVQALKINMASAVVVSVCSLYSGVGEICVFINTEKVPILLMQYRSELLPFLLPQQAKNGTTTGGNPTHSWTKEDFEKYSPEFLVTGEHFRAKTKAKAGLLLVYRNGCPACEDFKPKFLQLWQRVKEWNEMQQVLERDPVERNKTKTNAVFHPLFALAMSTMDPRNLAFIDRHLKVSSVPTLFLVDSSGEINNLAKQTRDPQRLWEAMQALKVVKRVFS